MSKLNPLYEKGDVTYFWNLHKQRQIQMGNDPISYRSFYGRLKSGMSLKEAIYTPRLRKMTNKINMKPKPLRNWWYRFISLFK